MPKHVRPPDLQRFKTLAGVPVHWGAWGRDVDQGRWLRPAFLALLESALAEVWQLCPWGPALGILSGGAYVPRDPPEPPARDRHQEGTAFDLSGIRWAPPGPTLLAYDALEQRPLYLAIEAVLRKWIPQSLDWWTNRDHHSHWHLDDREDALGFTHTHKADVLFTQQCLVTLWGADLGSSGPAGDGVDGGWGDLSRAAAAAAIAELHGVSGQTLEDLTVWHAFLEATALAGFGRVEQS